MFVVCSPHPIPLLSSCSLRFSNHFYYFMYPMFRLTNYVFYLTNYVFLLPFLFSIHCSHLLTPNCSSFVPRNKYLTSIFSIHYSFPIRFFFRRTKTGFRTYSFFHVSKEIAPKSYLPVPPTGNLQSRIPDYLITRSLFTVHCSQLSFLFSPSHE